MRSMRFRFKHEHRPRYFPKFIWFYLKSTKYKGAIYGVLDTEKEVSFQ